MVRSFLKLGTTATVAGMLAAAPLLGSLASAHTRCGSQVTVAPDDMLFRIASRCGATVAAILALNPRITNPNVIHVGQAIRLAPGQVAGVAPPPHDPRFMGPGLVIRLPGDRPRQAGDGRITVFGVVTREGVECPAIRGTDGRLYTLAGDVGPLEPGARVQVQGRRAEVSICMQGTTISVERLRRLG